MGAIPIIETAHYSLEWADVLNIYFIGLGGSLLVEFIAFVHACEMHGRHVPRRYQHFLYLISRFTLPLLYATVPVLLGANSVISALYIGASAPIVLDRLAQGFLNAARAVQNGNATL